MSDDAWGAVSLLSPSTMMMMIFNLEDQPPRQTLVIQHCIIEHRLKLYKSRMSHPRTFRTCYAPETKAQKKEGKNGADCWKVRAREERES